MTVDPGQIWAQRLGALSGECAGAYRAVYPQMAHALEGPALDRWASQGLRLAEAGWRGWECAAWYFKLSPHLLARLGLEGLMRLTEATLRALTVSPHLAIELLRGASAFAERDRQITIDEWAAMGERLIATARSGRLAAAYFEASPDVLSLTGLREFQEWVGLVQMLGATAEVPALEFVHHSAPGLDKIPPLARLQGLRLAQALARRMPSATLGVFSMLPGALRAVHAGVRGRLLEFALRVAEMTPQDLERLLKAASRSFQGLSQAEQEHLLDQCLQVALLDAEAAILLCEHLPAVLRQLVAMDVATWVAQGLAVLQDNREAGLGFFALESQTCQLQLAALARVVYLHTVQGMLRLYASALAGQALSVRPLAEQPAAFQSKLRHFPTTDGETIYLPDRVDRFHSREENVSLYVVMTAHQVGYLEFGTFHFAFEAFTAHLRAHIAPQDAALWMDAPTPPSGSFRSDFERFFAGFPRPGVARDLFYCVEDGRIDYRLRQTYRGLAPRIDHVIQEALASRPPWAGRPLWEAVLETLIQLCGSGTVSTPFPSMLVPLARFLRGLVTRVQQPQATVYDSAVVTVEVYRLLERLPNVRIGALADTAGDGELVVLTDILSRDAALEAFGQMMAALPTGEEVAYESPPPLPYQGDFKPDLIQRKFKVKELSDKLEQLAKAAMPISPELLQALLEQGVEIDIRGTSSQERDDTSGLFVSDLEGKGVPERVPASQTPADAARDRLREQLSEELRSLDGGEVVYRYDEWDYLMRDYRVGWCLLREKMVEGEEQGFVASVLEEEALLISQIRQQFQLLKPELFKKLKRRDHGEEIDIDAAIEGFVDRRVTGVVPERLYIKRDKREREVSTIFLVDLSASTDDPIEASPMRNPAVNRHPPRDPQSGFSGFVKDDGFYAPPFAAEPQQPPGKRIIDVEKEALVVMAEALESIGDEYAIYGFSGYGRENVEFFIVKEIEERYSDVIRRRIDVLKPYRSTRMGPPIRHAVQKLQRRSARLKTLILLSDGYPQDFDYGKDRRSKDYGIQDTQMALREARRKGIHTFCITVDREGKSYLPAMCGEDNFIVIEHITQLPQLLPKIYRGLTT